MFETTPHQLQTHTWMLQRLGASHATIALAKSHPVHVQIADTPPCGALDCNRLNTHQSPTGHSTVLTNCGVCPLLLHCNTQEPPHLCEATLHRDVEASNALPM